VAIVVNPQKRTPMFSLQEREDMLKASVTSIEGVRVEHFRGLLADYVKAAEADVIVKGLRVVSDFESEMSAAMMNRSLSDVDTLFLMADQKYSFVSSSLVKEVFFLGGDVAALVPEPVLRVMAEKRNNLQRR
jgi:pantetheine-phosphate adenylyltransferase